MRLFVSLLMLSAVAARRNTAPAPTVSDMEKNIRLRHWGYPCGWGLEPCVTEEPKHKDEEVTKTKQVKRVSKKKMEPVLPAAPKRRGLFGINPDKIHISDIEETMDGFE